MNIEYMKNFLLVQELGSFSKAAEQLYISQPALTKQIKKLETEIGHELFERNTRGMKLTASGEIFLAYAANICSQYDRMKNDIETEMLREYGSLKIGYVTDGQRNYVEKAVSLLLESQENVDVEVEDALPQELLKRIEDGLLDCAVMQLPSVRNVPSIAYSTILPGGLVARISRDNPLSHRKEISVRDLEPYTVVSLESTCPKCRAFVNKAFEESEVTIRRKYVGNLSTAELLSAGKNYISLTSDKNPSSNPKIVNVKVTELSSGFDLVLAWKENSDNPYIRKVLKLMKKDL